MLPSRSMVCKGVKLTERLHFYIFQNHKLFTVWKGVILPSRSMVCKGVKVTERLQFIFDNIGYCSMRGKT